MRKIYSLLFFLFLSVLMHGQQIGMFSHSFYKPMIYNPAFTGNGDATNAMLISRIQWIDFKNAPQLNIFTLDGSLRNKKMGLGIGLMSDKKGISNKIGGNISYAYRLHFNEETFLSFGVSVGLLDHSINYSRAILENANDPVINGDSQRETSLDANAGLAFNWKELEFGAAVPQLLGGAVEYQDNITGPAYYSLARHYMGSLKYRFFINKEKGLSISPMGMVRFLPNAPIQYDGNLNFEWKDKFWIGATYKSDYAVSANAGFCISRQLYLGYSYDIIIGNIGKYSGMAHEIMLNFKFGKSKNAGEPPIVEEPKNTPVITEQQQKVDSLQTELEIKENKIRSDAQRIKSDEQKIRELNEKLEQAKSASQNSSQQLNSNPPQTNGGTQNSIATPVKPGTENPSSATTPVKTNTENQNSTAISSSTNKVMNEGVWMMTNKNTEFKDTHNHSPQKGFYVIVGTFVYRDFAQAEVKRFINRGYRSTNWVYFEQKMYNYVFVARLKTKEEALKKVNEMRAAGVQDAWIQVLVD